MYAQTLLIVMLTLTLGMALLTNGLLSTRAAFNGLTSRYLDAAMTQSEAEMTANLRALVQSNGSNGPWPTAVQSLGSGSLCDALASKTSCPFSYQATWQITGSSSPSASPSLGPDLAQNLQVKVIDEQRVAVQINLTITSSLSSERVGSRTRFLTVRVFKATPYAIVSGIRDFETVNGRFAAAEGDNGGSPVHYLTSDEPADVPSPDPEAPEKYHDTTITLVVRCHNVLSVVDPMSANTSTQDDGLPWGAAPGGYEAPCVEPSGFASPPPSTLPVHLDYNASNLRSSEHWSGGNATKAGDIP